MRIAIFGTGGVGGYFGGRLGQVGEQVVFIARGNHLRALQRDGLRVESVHGDFTLHPVQASDDPGQVGEVDVVFLAVKTWQVQEAAQAIRPLLGDETVIVTLQNGVEAPAQVAEVVGQERVLPGVVKIFSFIDAPGKIRHIGGPTSIAFAEWDNRETERVMHLRETLKRAGVVVDETTDIQATLWAKFLLVVSLGGVGAVTRAPVGVLRSLPETRRMVEEAMNEIWHVARGHDIDLAENLIQQTISLVDTQPPAATSSLQRDIAAGRRSELDAWNGAVVRLGEEVGVATPLNRFIYNSLLPLERRARGELSFAD